MATARLRVSGQFIAQALNLPKDTIVRPVDLIVSHDDIPSGVDEVSALYRKHTSGSMRFLGWDVITTTAPR